MAEHTTPRRNQINKMSPTEVAILSTIRVVENLGADVRLTDAVVLLQAARESVADFLDGVDSRRYVSNPPLPAPAPPLVADDDPSVLHPIDDWHEDFGPVCWWADGEPPYFGTPLDNDFPYYLDGDHGCLGWSHLVVPTALTAALRPERREVGDA